MSATRHPLDRFGMMDLLGLAGRDVAEGRRLGEGVARPAQRSSELVVCGMGGSAIAGDLVAASLEGRAGAALRVRVSRGYTLAGPPLAPDALLVLSSYSGETEETLSVLRALPRGVTPLVVTSGGTLLAVAHERGWPVIRLETGRPPRAAVYFTWFALLAALSRAGIVPSLETELDEAQAVAGETACRNALGASADCPARQLAAFLHADGAPALPLLIATTPATAAVALRLRGEINENAKLPAWTAQLPEMHHNDVVGWTHLPAPAAYRAVILRDVEAHPSLAPRVAATRQVFEDAGIPVTKISGEGQGRLARLVSLSLLGDHASTYLAFLRDLDPTPIDVINTVKAYMQAHPPASG